MAGRAWDGGEAKVGEVSAMRQTQEFLREQLSAEYPLRLRKVGEMPLLFAGERDEMRYTAALPPRVVDGGVYYFRLAVAKSGDKSQLILERLIPDATCAAGTRIPRRRALGAGRRHRRVAYLVLRPRSGRRRHRRADLARPLERSAATAAPRPHRSEARERRGVAGAGRRAAARAGGRVRLVRSGTQSLRGAWADARNVPSPSSSRAVAASP